MLSDNRPDVKSGEYWANMVGRVCDAMGKQSEMKEEGGRRRREWRRGRRGEWTAGRGRAGGVLLYYVPLRALVDRPCPTWPLSSGFQIPSGLPRPFTPRHGVTSSFTSPRRPSSHSVTVRFQRSASPHPHTQFLRHDTRASLSPHAHARPRGQYSPRQQQRPRPTLFSPALPQKELPAERARRRARPRVARKPNLRAACPPRPRNGARCRQPVPQSQPSAQTRPPPPASGSAGCAP